MFLFLYGVMFINELYNSVFHFAKKEDCCEHLRFHYLSGIYLGLDFSYFVECYIIQCWIYIDFYKKHVTF